MDVTKTQWNTKYNGMAAELLRELGDKMEDKVKDTLRSDPIGAYEVYERPNEPTIRSCNRTGYYPVEATLAKVLSTESALYKAGNMTVYVSTHTFAGPRFKVTRGSKTIPHKFADNPTIVLRKVSKGDKGWRADEWELLPEKESNLTEEHLRNRAFNI